MAVDVVALVFNRVPPFARVLRVDRGQCDVAAADGVLRAAIVFVTSQDPMRAVYTGRWILRTSTTGMMPDRGQRPAQQ